MMGNVWAGVPSEVDTCSLSDVLLDRPRPTVLFGVIAECVNDHLSLDGFWNFLRGLATPKET